MTVPTDENTSRNNNNNTGLGHSTPLVTVQASAVHGTGIVRPPPAVQGGLSNNNSTRRSTTMAHPLAVVPSVDVTPTSPTSLPPPPPPVIATSTQPAAVVPTVATVPTPPPTTLSPPKATTSPTVAALTPPPIKAPPTTTSLDVLADAFLSGPSARTVEKELPPLFRPPPLPPHQEGLSRLRTLVERRAWGDVLQVTSTMLRTPSSPYHNLYESLVKNDSFSVDAKMQDELVEILHLEIQAWLKLRRYADLGRQVQQWKFLSFQSEPNETLSWVPWSLHILAAETLQYTEPDSKRCVDVLTILQNDILQSDSHKALDLTFVHHALANAYLRLHEYRLALVSLDGLWEALPQATRELVEWQFPNLPRDQYDLVVDTLKAAFTSEVASRQGRIMLQAGGLEGASILFQEAQAQQQLVFQTLKQKTLAPVVHDYLLQRGNLLAQVHVDHGTLCFSHCDYDKAVSFYTSAIDTLRQESKQHGTLLESKYRVQDYTGPCVICTRSNFTLLTEACNNMALCALYTCRMHEAVSMMESLLREDPTAFFIEGLVFNLCTLYELGADQPTCTRKKRVLQLVSKRFFLHDVGPESFRLNP